MNLRSRSLVAFVMFGLLIGLAPISLVRAEAVVANPGDLIRGTSFSAVYYMGTDGFRYVFPNDKTYFTWYSDFSTVKMLSDADLATIQLGGNVTYRPGARMVKINSDPKTYMVTQGGTLRWISSETLAASLYGAAWASMIDDVPDGFFGNYVIGDAVDATEFASGSAEEFVQEAFEATERIDDNFAWIMRSPIRVNLTDRGFSGIHGGTPEIYEGNVIVFTNSDTTVHSATADDNSWGTGTLQPGQSFSKRFSAVGTYPYFDSYNMEEVGSITVVTDPNL